jgi:type VI secretion system protein ImpJ
MRSLTRVVWSEGMHLSQHHFQAQTRYFEDVGTFAVSQLFFAPYGLAELEMNADALLNGTVVLTHARGLMGDGLAFAIPDDPPPAPLPIGELFSPTQDAHVVHLAIPPYRVDGANCAAGGNGAGAERYFPAPHALIDEATGRDEKPVSFAAKGFRLLLDSQLEEELVTLPIARVRRDGAGHFVYDPDYVPPVLRIGASPALLRLLGRLVEILESKADTLRLERESGHGSLADYASREVASFWLSHAIHAALGPLRHHLEHRSSHPEALFTELSRLAGSLCTFSLQSHPRELPIYRHDELEAVFGELDRHVRGHLDLMLPQNSVVVSLQQSEPCFHTGKVLDRRCLERAHWYLGVRSSAGPGEVAASGPRLVKLCSAEHISKLVARAFPGLDLTHVPAPPAAISPRPGTEYFYVTRSGPCWDLILQTAGIGVYVPDAIPDAELHLSVVLEG